ncbi:MAG: BlaI/MecI/CopY family transcriptional regulator [Chloroherpetonaceae bacterium]|nr:BlaI/MecI/CopY family transcriptional regulator [Chthonomonadaceae bacterium]MDW8206685.1 BlaI/MecI/CopY family transcriptional regulator [Chloroherpetonaceae bacterium]
METTETTKVKRRKYVGVGGDDVPSLGVLEGDILRLLWDAGEPQSSVQVYEAMHFARRAEKREMQSPSTIAVTLSRMVEKGLLTVERRPRGGKGYYGPTKSRAEIVAKVMDDVCRRLTGQPFGYLLTQLRNPERGTGRTDVEIPDDGLEEVITELRRVEREEGKPLPRLKMPDLG